MEAASIHRSVGYERSSYGSDNRQRREEGSTFRSKSASGSTSARSSAPSPVRFPSTSAGQWYGAAGTATGRLQSANVVEVTARPVLNTLSSAAEARTFLIKVELYQRRLNSTDRERAHVTDLLDPLLLRGNHIKKLVDRFAPLECVDAWPEDSFPATAPPYVARRDRGGQTVDGPTVATASEESESTPLPATTRTPDGVDDRRDERLYWLWDAAVYAALKVFIAHSLPVETMSPTEIVALFQKHMRFEKKPSFVETCVDVEERYEVIIDRNGLQDAITGDKTQKLLVKMLTKLVQPHQFRLLLERDVDRESKACVSLVSTAVQSRTRVHCDAANDCACATRRP